MDRYVSRHHPDNGVVYVIDGDLLIAYRGDAMTYVYQQGEWDFRDLIRIARGRSTRPPAPSPALTDRSAAMPMPSHRRQRRAVRREALGRRRIPIIQRMLP